MFRPQRTSKDSLCTHLAQTERKEVRVSMKTLVTSPRAINGFSLMELLIVLVILSLITGLVAPESQFYL